MDQGALRRRMCVGCGAYPIEVVRLWDDFSLIGSSEFTPGAGLLGLAFGNWKLGAAPTCRG